jgi:hypothetical protein
MTKPHLVLLICGEDPQSRKDMLTLCELAASGPADVEHRAYGLGLDVEGDPLRLPRTHSEIDELSHTTNFLGDDLPRKGTLQSVSVIGIGIDTLADVICMGGLVAHMKKPDTLSGYCMAGEVSIRAAQKASAMGVKLLEANTLSPELFTALGFNKHQPGSSPKIEVPVLPGKRTR